MLFLIISLFTLNYLFSCVNNEIAKFDEFLLMKQHHQNILQIKHFIREAQHKFHEQKSVLRVGDYVHESTRDDELLDHSITNWWWDNTSSIDQLGLDMQQSFFLPLIRSRPSFPFSITPYTTELNNQHLKWDEIFPNQNVYTRPSEPRFRTGLKVSSSANEPVLPQLLSKTLMQRPKDQIPSSFFQPSKLHKSSEPLHPNTTSTSPKISLRDHSGGIDSFGPTNTLITPNEEYNKIWLREITTYTPVERWFKTLPTQTGMTPSFDYTTKGALQLGLTPTNASEAQALVSTKQLKNDSKDQPLLILRQGLPLSDTPAEVDVSRYLTASTATAKTAQFHIEDVGTATHKIEEKTKMIDEIPVNDGMVKITSTTTRDVQWYREQKPETPTPSSRKSRRFQSIARKRKHHYNSHKRQKPRQTFQKHRYRHHEYSSEDIYQKQQQNVEYPMLRRMKETTEDQKRFSFNTPKHSNRGIEKDEARPSENRRHREPTPLPNAMSQFFSENDDRDDENLIKLIERQDDSRHESTNKVYFYQHVKESLKQAESKKKAKRLKLKAELLRKIVEGSSYSDEEASLKKNLIQALQYRNKDFEHKPTFLRT